MINGYLGMVFGRPADQTAQRISLTVFQERYGSFLGLVVSHPIRTMQSPDLRRKKLIQEYTVPSIAHGDRQTPEQSGKVFIRHFQHSVSSGERAPWQGRLRVIFEWEIAEEHQLQRTEVGQYIRLPPWCWRSLRRAQASGADRRRACPATGDILALAWPVSRIDSPGSANSHSQSGSAWRQARHR